MELNFGRQFSPSDVACLPTKSGVIVKYIQALCDMTIAELETIILGLGLHGAVLTMTSQRVCANAVVRLAQRLGKMKELR
jgi:hypothetical protein